MYGAVRRWLVASAAKIPEGSVGYVTIYKVDICR
jgi:hypothetical protein